MFEPVRFSCVLPCVRLLLQLAVLGMGLKVAGREASSLGVRGLRLRFDF